MKKIAGVTLEQVQEDTLWVAKMSYGVRHVGTHDEVGNYCKDDECKDFFLCAVQPDHLKPFMERMEQLDKEHGWMTFPEMFDRFGE